jgi:hypothetical protein
MTVSSVPDQPTSVRVSINQPSVKVATPDLILFDEALVPIELMTDLIFEDIGGQELINLVRNDILSGEDVIYQPVKNITELHYKYHPQNILNLQGSSQSYFKSYPIKLEDKIPLVGNGPEGQPVYLDTVTGNIIIDVVNLKVDEQIEVQIISSGEILNGTIYGE